MNVQTNERTMIEQLESLVEAPEEVFQRTIQAVSNERQLRKSQSGQIRHFANTESGVLLFQKQSDDTLKYIGHHDTLFGGEAIEQAVQKGNAPKNAEFVYAPAGSVWEKTNS